MNQSNGSMAQRLNGSTAQWFIGLAAHQHKGIPIMGEEN